MDTDNTDSTDMDMDMDSTDMDMGVVQAMLPMLIPLRSLEKTADQTPKDGQIQNRQTDEYAA